MFGCDRRSGQFRQREYTYLGAKSLDSRQSRRKPVPNRARAVAGATITAGCSNELDAAYAADGYARVRGCSMLMTTYAVGELSALNGVLGAKAERSCVFHVVGMPTMRKQRVRQIIHHTLGDGEFQNFANISAQAACVSAVITPDNCAHEVERLIATARADSRPA